jgi:hypothetical protein
MWRSPRLHLGRLGPGNPLRLDGVEEGVTTAACPGDGPPSAGCRPLPARRSLCARAVVGMVIVCIAALGGCSSAPAPNRTAVTTPAATTSPAAGPAWTELEPAASPPARGSASMAYDAATRTVLLFGGFASADPAAYDGEFGYLHDTWSWNGTTWRKLSPAASPPARAGALMAYDAATRTVLLFGGEGDGGWLSDTWSWNGATWTRLSPASNPGSSDTDSMAYDPVTRTVLLFSGGVCNSCGGQGQTWSWNGITWTRLSPSASPPASGWSSMMAYDPATRTVLLFDGAECSPCLGGQGQTWSWNGVTWTRLSPSASPPASGGWSMAYDPATATMLLYGGMAYRWLVTALHETWSWNGTTWIRLSSGPPPRGGASMAYDPGMEAMLLVEQAYGNYTNSHGEFDDTWTLTAPSRPSGPS